MNTMILRVSPVAIVSLALTSCGEKSEGNAPALTGENNAPKLQHAEGQKGKSNATEPKGENIALKLNDAKGQKKKSYATEPTGKTIILRLNFAKGQKKSLTTEIDMIVNGDSETVEMTVTADQDFIAREIDAEGVHDMEMKITRSRTKMRGPMTLDYDSDDPASKNTSTGRQMGAMIGHPIRIKMSSAGRIIDVSGHEDLPAATAKEFEGMQDPLVLRAMNPDNPIDNGDTWSRDFNQSLGNIDAKMQATYTLLERKDGNAIVGIDGSVSGDVNGDITGVLHYELATGWISEGTMTMNGTGNVGGTEMKLVADYSFSGK